MRSVKPTAQLRAAGLMKPNDDMRSKIIPFEPKKQESDLKKLVLLTYELDNLMKDIEQMESTIKRQFNILYLLRWSSPL